MVLPRFVELAVKGLPLKVHGDGRQTRCFCHVSDVVAAMIRLTDRNDVIGQVFNLGSDEEISIIDLARRVVSVCESKSQIEFVSYEQAYGQRFDDTQRRVPRLDKLRSVIEFFPRYGLDQIIVTVMNEQLGSRK
jgi:UDP-glucose 4-epimerase